MNSIRAIHPYRHLGIWVFDDESVGLVQEPFVSGADDIIDRMSAAIPDADKGVTMLFSQQPFPGWKHVLDRRREEMNGTWYWSEEFGMEGWLCPALFKYFAAAPEKLYVQVKPRGK